MGLVTDIRRFSNTLWEKRGAIYEVAKRDLEAQFKNTYLGMIWAFLQPMVFVITLWVVFTVGLRSNPGGEVPFVVYLISGMIAWQYFSTTFPSLTGVVQAHSFLVKKGDFNLALLHVAKLLAGLLPHFVLILVVIGVCWLHGLPPTLYCLQILYYLAGMVVLLLGLGWITSSTNVFIQDVGNIVGIIVQFGFWLTPIVWNVKIVDPKYQWIVHLNPAAYIVDGYRDSMIYHRAFWSKPYETAYFLLFTLIVLWIGSVVFRRLKPHFGEVI